MGLRRTIVLHRAVVVAAPCFRGLGDRLVAYVLRYTRVWGAQSLLEGYSRPLVPLGTVGLSRYSWLSKRSAIGNVGSVQICGDQDNLAQARNRRYSRAFFKH